MKNMILFILSIAGLVFFSGCEKDNSPESAALEIDAVIEENATIGWQINEIVDNSFEIEELTGKEGFVDADLTYGFSALSRLKSQAASLLDEALKQLQVPPLLSKVNPDSLIFFSDDTSRGVRQALYFDPVTASARFYEVHYKLPAALPARYDSAEIVITVEQDLFSAQGNKLSGLYHLRTFREDFFVQRVSESLTVTDYNGDEISGIHLNSYALYRSDSFLDHIERTVMLNPNHSGTLQENFYFSDATSSYRTVTFNPDQTGEFAKGFRDGTTVSGTFDSAADDLSGFYTELIDFPDGRYLDKIFRSAAISISVVDSTFFLDLAEIIYFSDGRIDSCAINMTTVYQSSLKTTTWIVIKPNGAHGHLILRESEKTKVLAGEWTTANGYYLLINAEYYLDGSVHIHYVVYVSENAYLAGDDPLLTADYYLSPDKSGDGTITSGNQVYQIRFDDSGQGTISRGDKSKVIPIYP